MQPETRHVSYRLFSHAQHAHSRTRATRPSHGHRKPFVFDIAQLIADKVEIPEPTGVSRRQQLEGPTGAAASRALSCTRQQLEGITGAAASRTLRAHSNAPPLASRVPPERIAGLCTHRKKRQ